MITSEELKRLITNLESDRVELTISTNNTDKFSEAVCAFANDLPNNGKPGYLIIGVNNEGLPEGIEITDTLLTSLGGLRSNGNIQPMPQINVGKVLLDGKEVAVVEVMPSFYPPVRYNGSVWVRIGPRKAKASQQEEHVLTEKRISNAKSFDACAAYESSIEDLSISLFTAYRKEVVSADIIEANHRSTEEQMASLRFYDTLRNCATNAGLIIFGKNTRYFLSGAYIQYLKISGTHITDDLIDQAEISGDLLSVLRELDSRIRTNINSILVSNTSLTEKLIADYPERAIRELLMNAVMHRDYQSNAPIKFYWFSDRIEIHSPGNLYGVVTIENIETSSDYRNPIIAESMKALGYVNKYGYGIQQAQKSLKENGNPRAEFSCPNNVFLATIKKRT